MNGPLGKINLPPRRENIISASIAARYPQYLYPLSLAQVERMCREKVFKSAYKPGMGQRARWFLSANEILLWKTKRSAEMLDT